MKKNLGFESVLAVKTNHSSLPKQEVESLMKKYPSGSHLVLSGQVDGQILYFVGYKYNSKKVLLFLCSENSGLFTEGEPYLAKFPDHNGNVMHRKVPRPSVISEYFGVSNAVDRHNHLRQAELKLEKHWVTKDPWFCINTTAVGMTVTDAFLLAKSQSNNSKLNKMTVCKFADNLAWDLIHNLDSSIVPCNYIPSSSATLLCTTTCHPVTNVEFNHCTSPISAITTNTEEEHKLGNWDKFEKNGVRRLRRKCKICKGKKTASICIHPICKNLEINLCSEACLEDHKRIVLNTNV